MYLAERGQDETHRKVRVGGPLPLHCRPVCQPCRAQEHRADEQLHAEEPGRQRGEPNRLARQLLELPQRLGRQRGGDLGAANDREQRERQQGRRHDEHAAHRSAHVRVPHRCDAPDEQERSRHEAGEDERHDRQRTRIVQREPELRPAIRGQHRHHARIHRSEGEERGRSVERGALAGHPVPRPGQRSDRGRADRCDGVDDEVEALVHAATRAPGVRNAKTVNAVRPMTRRPSTSCSRRSPTSASLGLGTDELLHPRASNLAMASAQTPVSSSSSSSCRTPFELSTFDAVQDGVPSRSVIRPPASVTIT